MKRDNGWSRGRLFGPHQGENRKQPQQAGIQKKRCFRGRLTNHSPGDCKYKGSECFKCHLTGHLQSECRKGRSLSKKFAGKQHVRHTGQDFEDGGPGDTREEFFGSLFSLERNQKPEIRKPRLAAPAVKVPVRIEHVEFHMEVDTGAAASILNYEDYERYFNHSVLRPVERSFHAYAGTLLDIAGQIMVHVEHNRQRATLPLLVVRAERYAPPLLGRSWLMNVRLDWKNLFPSHNGQFSAVQDTDVRVEHLKEQYAEIFKPELGTVQGVSAIPVFKRACPVPYALRSAVEEELCVRTDL